MKRIGLLIIALIFLSVSAKAGSITQPPQYADWKTCFGEKTKTCFDNPNPLLADNVITEYFDKISNQRALLIWCTNVRSKKVFHMHGTIKSYEVEKITYRFYRASTASERWQLIGTRTLSRNSSPKNTHIALFDKNSKFGMAYIALMKKNGEKDNEIEIPSMEFLR